MGPEEEEEREDDRQTDRRHATDTKTDVTQIKTRTQKKKKWKQKKTKQNKKEWLTAKKKKISRTAHTHGTRLGGRVPLYLPPHKYVTGLFPSEVIIVLQYNFVCIPNNHPELISGRGGRKEHDTHTQLDLTACLTGSRELAIQTDSPSHTLEIKLHSLLKKD